MKKFLKALTKRIFIFLGILGIIVAIILIRKEPLKPEVAEILKGITIDESTLDNNAYVGLVAFFVPEDADYMEIGKKVILHNTAQANKELKDQSYTGNIDKDCKTRAWPSCYVTNRHQMLKIQRQVTGVGGYEYESKMPCVGNILPNNNSCIEEALAQKKIITTLIDANKTLLKRYDQMAEFPVFDSYPMDILSILNTIHYTDEENIRYLSQFRLLEAVFAIEEGNVNKGLLIINKEISFYKKMLYGSGGDYLNAIIQLNRSYRIISELLDSPKLATELNNPLLIELLKPFHTTDTKQQGLTKAFKLERNQYLYMVSSKKLNMQSKIIVDKNRALNKIYDDYQPIIQHAALTLPFNLSIPEISRDYNNMASFKEYCFYYLGIFNQRDLWDRQANTSSKYGVVEYVDLANYLAAIKLKLQIKQANITAAEVADFLSKLGDQAKTPYGEFPYQWDEIQQILYFEKLNINKFKKINPNDINYKTHRIINVKFSED